MFERDWEFPEDDSNILCAEVDPDAVAEWAAACPAPDAIHTPFGELDPQELSRRGRLDALVALERQRAWIDFQQQRVLAAIAAEPGDSPTWLAKNLAREEVGCALRIPDAVAEAKLHTASVLAGQFPATLAALRDGDISLLHARILVDATWDLDAAVAAAVEAAVLPRAAYQTAASFRRSVNRARARLAPRTADEAHAGALADRRVEAHHRLDGMGELRTHLSGEDMLAVWDVISADARELLAAGDERTMPQLRADCLVDRVLGRASGSTGGTGASGAHVQVTVALSTLTGLEDQPGELAGYGPIPAAMARSIATRPGSVWRRLVTDEFGQLLDYGRRTYRPPAGLADHVRAHDQRCVFPTCNRRAADCDLDHLKAWQAHGETNPDNLAAECPRHHQVKHEGGWAVERLPDGTVRWISPTSHVYDKPLDPLPIDRTAELIIGPDPPPF